MLPKGTKIKVKDTHDKDDYATWYKAGDTFTVHSYIESVRGYVTEQDFFDYGNLVWVDADHIEPSLESPEQPSLSTRKDGKVLMDLVETGFPHSMNALGEVLTWAANNKGYLPNDWKGLDTNSFLGAAARHRNWRLRGVERDEESNLYHLTHELFNILAQLELQLIKDQA